MDEILDELFRTLNEELLLQRNLLDLSRTKRDALVKIDTAGLDAVNRREQNVLLALGATAQQRLRLTMEASKSLSLAQAGVGAIADRVGEPWGSKLRGVAEELKAVMKELDRVTQACKLLAEESLGFVKQFFQIVANAAQEQPAGYTRKGEPPAPGPARLMIDEVA